MNETILGVQELREALEASWDRVTSYRGVYEAGNPALGQCYPTSRVVQNFFPDIEIVEGQVWTGIQTEKHFWNILVRAEKEYRFDFTWQQFPPGSTIIGFKVRHRESLGDSQQTVERCNVLRDRVSSYLSRNKLKV